MPEWMEGKMMRRALTFCCSCVLQVLFDQSYDKADKDYGIRLLAVGQSGDFEVCLMFEHSEK